MGNSDERRLTIGKGVSVDPDGIDRVTRSHDGVHGDDGDVTSKRSRTRTGTPQVVCVERTSLPPGSVRDS